MGEHELWELGLRSIRELETDTGILASARGEVYGCIFGRDSAITSLSLLRVWEKRPDPYYLGLVRKVLCSLVELQGTEINIESGEEPGKCIHEYRPTDHGRLSASITPPWYVYPDGALRNYDSVDATPLFLLLMYRFGQVSGEWDFIAGQEVAIRRALLWLLDFADSNGDGFVDYQFHPDRQHGGLRTQSWMDSTESVFYEYTSARPPYPIAPIEVQAYAWAALSNWGAYFATRDAEFAQVLHSRAEQLKAQFNAQFVRQRGGKIIFPFALDGNGTPLTSARSSIGHLLWAVNREGTSILNSDYIPALVQRVLARDLFVPNAGVRTLSSRSRHFDPLSYHNGSVWPHDTAILSDGLENFGYTAQAGQVRHAALRAYKHFKTPVELFGYTRGAYKPYQGACQTQAWSAASLLTTLAALQYGHA